VTAQQTLGGILNIEMFENVNITIALASFDSETDDFIFRSLNISQNLANEFCEIPIQFLSSYSNLNENGDLILHEFTGGYKPDNHEIEWLDYNNNEIIEALCEVPTSVEIMLVDLDDNSFFKNLRFYTLIIENGEQRYLFFRRYGKSKELTRSKNLFVRLAGERYERLEEPTFQFDDKFDVVIHNGYLFSFNKNNFQHIFKYYEMLRASAQLSLETIAAAIPIANFQAFQNTCMGHLQKLAKLRNIAAKPYLANVTMDNIRSVINTYELTIEIIEEDGEEKIVFDENNKWAILNLLDDAYLSSIMTGINYEANSKHEI